MAQLSGSGPENKGNKTGRRLGLCDTSAEQIKGIIGNGMGLRRKSGGGLGKGKRRKYNIQSNENKCID